MPITVLVTLLQGLTSTDTATVTITSPSGQNPPVADAGGPYSGLTFEDIIFDGSKSYDSDGGIVNYSWDFGDGNIKYGQRPVHSYNTQGLYNITLTVTDDDGLMDSDNTTIDIILDSDGDGVSDEEELEIGSDPFKNDIVFIEIQGKTYYLIDTENGIPNRFYDPTMGKDILFKALDDGTILLDIDQDGTWDYIYNPASGAITSYKEDKPSDEMPWLLILISIIIAIIIIIAVLFMLGIIYIERETEEEQKKNK